MREAIVAIDKSGTAAIAPQIAQAHAYAVVKCAIDAIQHDAPRRPAVALRTHQSVGGVRYARVVDVGVGYVDQLRQLDARLARVTRLVGVVRQIA